MSNPKVSAWMPLYVGEYLADTGHLTTEEHGAYLLLLMHYWSTGKPLPNDKQMLARICRTTPRRFTKIFEKIESFFELSGNTLLHKRVEKEIAKAKDKRQKRAEAGRKGGLKKAEKTDSNGEIIRFMSREEL